MTDMSQQLQSQQTEMMSKRWTAMLQRAHSAGSKSMLATQTWRSSCWLR